MSARPAPAPQVPVRPDLVGRVRATGRCELLLQLLTAAGFLAKLARPGPFTLLAPPDVAFIDLPPEAVVALLEDAGQARAFVRRHVCAGAFPAAELRQMRWLTTLSGKDVPVDTADGIGVRVGGIAVTHPDLTATNGVVHLLEGLLDAG